MEISDKQIQEFKEIYQKETGKEISDDEAYKAAQNLAGFAELCYESYVKERRIDGMLKNSPKGFFISEVGSGSYTCMICDAQVSGQSGWWDKYGPKCLICQKAVDDNKIDAWVLEDRDNWYKMWNLKNKLNLHSATVAKMIREGKIKAQFVPTAEGKVHEYLFVIEDNYSLLPPKDFEKRNMLLMSSGTFFTEKAPKLYKANFKDLKIAYINTATKKVKDDTYSKKQLARMKELDWNVKVIDLADLREHQAFSEFDGIDIIYVEGGNTFYLLEQMRRTKFARVVKDMTRNGALYAGVSAGAYVVCPTIEMATWTNPDKLDRCGITDLHGMGLVPFIINAHTTPTTEKKIQDKIKQTKFEVKLLTDEQALMVYKGEVHLVS